MKTSEEHLKVMLEVRKLLDERLGLTIQNHGLWRIQFLVEDELEEKDKIEEQSNKEKEKIHLA
tara:strand:- start:18515 stop:18703 length:189 start_codon:yes stop_codon:yes gene_type:complete